MNVVIFGSAASPATRGRARDVDVAFTGDQEDAERVASEWAHAHGLAGLPLDVHKVFSLTPGEVRIPSPCGIDVPAIPLTPGTTARPVAVHTVAAAVRAFGNDRRLLARHVPERDRLAVIPDESHGGPDWEGYVGGLAALRRAVVKTPDPDTTVRVLADAYGTLLARLVHEDPTPDEDSLATLQLASPVAAGGAVVLLLLRGQDSCLPYNRLPVDRVESLLYP